MIKKVSQFGGNGGQYSPYTPGGSPMFRGGPSGYEGYGVNDFGADLSLDTIMSRTNKPQLYGFERSMESMLEAFHDDIEKDAENCLLDFDERQKLKRKKKIRNKNQFIEDIKNNFDKQDDHFLIKKKIKTMENLLEEFRKNTGVDFGKLASAKISSYFRRKISPPLLDEFLPTVEEYNDEDNPLSLTKNILTQPFTGNDVVYNPEDGLDKYLKDLTSEYYPNQHANFPGLMHYPNEDQIGYHNVEGSPFELPSPITPESLSNNQSLESKLEKLKKNDTGIGRLDPNIFTGLDWDEKIKGQYPNRGVSKLTPYEPDGLGTLKNDAISGNSPYSAYIK